VVYWTLKYAGGKLKLCFCLIGMQYMNDLRRIDLNLLVILEALLQERHVTRAAQRLHLSQPAVSHALGRLRELLDDPLLERRPGGLVLTARALGLQRPLAEALAQVRAMLLPQGFEPASAQRSFHLAMSDYGAAAVLPGLVRTLRREAPGIDLQVSQGSREAMLEGLAAGDIDLAAAVFPQLPHELRSETLFEEHFACLVDRASLPPDGLLDLPGYLARPHIRVELRGGGSEEVERALTTLRERRRVALSLPHWRIAPELIKGTDLVLTVAARGLGGIDDPALQVCPPPFRVAPFAFVMAWHGRRDGDQALAWLRQQVVVASRARPA
jgi:DNA-binding transcriptional LysR family regulator